MKPDVVWITPDDAEHIGVGRQAGPLRLDWGDNWAELTCTTCGAGWVGPIGEQCAWCDLSLERQRQWQAQLVLQPPDVDPDDVRYTARMHAWKGRLKRAVQAELITDQHAKRAWERATRDTGIPDRRRPRPTGRAA